jgi:hypothetical protein
MVLFSNPVTIAQGAPGAPAYLYIAWASDDIGTDFTTTFDPLLDYVALKVSYSILTPVVGDFAGLWKNYKGTQGAPGTDPIGNVTNVDPTVDDDSSIGYSAGSWWINTVAHKYFVCESSSIGLAVWNLVYPTREYVTAPIEVDHAASSPVSLGTAPANSIVELIVRCTENKNGCVLTIGDADDADSHCIDAMMPVTTTAAPMIGPLGKQYYSASKALMATITTAGSSGKWNIQFKITLVA